MRRPCQRRPIRPGSWATSSPSIVSMWPTGGMARYAAVLAAAAGEASVLINNAGVAHGGMFTGM